MDKIAVLVPCYNESKTVKKVVEDCRRVLPEAVVYVYDNNSTDGTAELAAAAGAVVRHEYQQGKGNVLRDGKDAVIFTCGVMVEQCLETVEILKAYPDIKGFFDCSVHGSAIAQALKDKKRTDIKVVSLAMPSTSANYLKDGSIYKGLAWRPADAGYATCYAAYKLVKGEEITTGTDLKATGYNEVKVEDGIAYGFAPLVFTADNISDYNF